MMQDYSKLVEALRHCATRSNGCVTCAGCPMSSENGDVIECINALHKDAADAIEKLVTLYEKSEIDATNLTGKLAQAEAQLPKRGEIVRCGECAHCYAEGFAHERNICEKHPELGNVPDDWFCADGEREVQE